MHQWLSMKYIWYVYERDFLSNDDFSVFNTHLTWIFMGLEKIPEIIFFIFINIYFLSFNGFYMKCMLIEFYFLLEFNRGERDTFSSRAGIFIYSLSLFNCFFVEWIWGFLKIFFALFAFFPELGNNHDLFMISFNKS